MRNHELLDEKFDKFQKIYEGMNKKRIKEDKQVDEAIKFSEYVTKKVGGGDWVVAKKGTKAGIKPGQKFITKKEFTKIENQFKKEYPEEAKRYFGSSFREDQLDEAKSSVSLSKTPKGSYIFRGSVPVELSYVNKDGSELNDEQAKQVARSNTPGMIAKTRVFKTPQEAKKIAKKYEVTKFDVSEEEQLDEVIQPSTVAGLAKNGKIIEKGSSKKMRLRRKELSEKDPNSKYAVWLTTKPVGTVMKDDIGTAYHGKTGSTEKFQNLQHLVETYEDDPTTKLKGKIDLLIGELKLNSEGVYRKK